MSDSLEAFLAGDRPDDVAVFLAETYVEDDRLESFGEPVNGGVVIVVDGERGRNAFRAATGLDAMAFAQSAMQFDGIVDDDLSGGQCPEAPTDEDHEVQFVFAFAEERNDDAGGLYADGDVVHAYAMCSCGTAFSDRWTVQEG